MKITKKCLRFPLKNWQKEEVHRNSPFCFHSMQTVPTGVPTCTWCMGMIGARFAVFARRVRVLPSPSQATRNLSFLEVSTGTVTCCFNSYFTGLVPGWYECFFVLVWTPKQIVFNLTLRSNMFRCEMASHLDSIVVRSDSSNNVYTHKGIWQSIFYFSFFI